MNRPLFTILAIVESVCMFLMALGYAALYFGNGTESITFLGFIIILQTIFTVLSFIGLKDTLGKIGKVISVIVLISMFALLFAVTIL